MDSQRCDDIQKRAYPQSLMIRILQTVGIRQRRVCRPVCFPIAIGAIAARLMPPSLLRLSTHALLLGLKTSTVLLYR